MVSRQNINKNMNENLGQIGLYIHWPYCTRLCPYCDFNIYKNKTQNNYALTQAIIRDIYNWRKKTGKRQLVSIHFGGGTPSLMDSNYIEEIIITAKSLWDINTDIEIGLEANPCDINEPVLQAWLNAGIERLSIGVQSFNDNALVFLGRNHDRQTAKEAAEQAVKIMPRVSVDLIFGWEGQSKKQLQYDIKLALNAGAKHISIYQLTIEADTAFGRAANRGNFKAVSADESASLFAFAIDMLNNSGFEQYEISNFAKNEQSRSRHNLVYWQGGDYAGIGPGAHGRIWQGDKKHAITNHMRPDDYINSVKQTGSGIAHNEIMQASDVAAEYVLMGLRIKTGINLEYYRQLTGHKLNPQLLQEFISDGFLQKQKDRIFATAKGRMVLDIITSKLLV